MHIDSYRFGRIEVDGEVYSKDVMLLRDRVVSPWWREAGGHLFAASDIEQLIAEAPEVAVLGTGYFGMVRIADDTLSALQRIGSAVVVERTRQAIETFNRYGAEGVDVAAALHLTC